MSLQNHSEPNMTIETYVTNDTDALNGFHVLHEREAPSSEDGLSSSKDKMTYTRLAAIFALALTNTGSQIHTFFLGPGTEFMAPDLHIGSERSWIPVANSLSCGCVALTVGYLQDLFGRKIPLGIGFLFMIVGITVIATSNSFSQSVAGSVVTGVGSALQELGSIAAISEMVPVRQRGFFLAIHTSFALLFTPALLYAELLNTSGWRWLFWVALMWNVVALVLMCFTYFKTKLTRESQPNGQVRLRDFDFVGIFLLVVGLTLFLVGVQSGGNVHSWTSAYVLCQLIIGFALFVLFVFWESRGHGRPLMPFRIFRGQRLVGLSLVVAALSSICYYSVLNLGPEILGSVFAFSPVGLGVIGLGPSISLAVGAITFNVLLTLLHGHARELLTVSSILMTAFTGAQACVNPTNSTTFAILGSFASIGIGATLIPVQTIVTLACPQDLIATAVALSVAMQTIGGAIGYAILYNIFLSRSKTTIPQQMAPRIIAAGWPRNETATYITQFIRAISTNGALPHSNERVQAAALEGFRWGTSEGAHLVYYVSIAFSGLAIVCSIMLPDIRRYMTNRVLA